MLTWLLEATHNNLVPGFFLVAVGLVGVVTVLSLPETRATSLIKEQDLETSSAAAFAGKVDHVGAD